MHDKPICECCEKEIACFIPKRCTECNKEALNMLEKKLEEEARIKREHIENILFGHPFWYFCKEFSYNVLLYMVPLFCVGIIYGLKYELIAVAGGIHVYLYRAVKYWLMEKF